MVRSNSQTTAIFDAGPIIHLDELSSLILISDFYPIIISETVQKEIIKHRPQALQNSNIEIKVMQAIPHLDLEFSILSKIISLDKGEQESLLLMKTYPDAIFFTDDAAARMAGEKFGYKVHGTIGILLRAIRKEMKTRKEIINLLNRIPKETTLFIKSSLLEEIIQKIRGE